MLTLTFTLDGTPVTLTAEPKRPAVDVLREELGVRSLKPGCSPQGICGSCAASVNGKFRLTCTLPFKSLADKDVQTLDGWSDARRARWAAAFAATGATRAAYSAPGLVAHAALLEGLAEDKVLRGLNMHACRSGWADVVQALEVKDAPPASAREHDIAMGRMAFVGDRLAPDVLHGAIVPSPIVRGTVRVDASAALAMDGVIAVFGPELGVGLDGGPLLASTVEHAGRPVALVVATSRFLARQAAEQVVVDATERAPQLDPRSSRVVVGSALDEDGVPTSEPQVEVRIELSLAATDAGCVEPEGAIAVPNDLGVSVATNGSCAGMERIAAAAATGLLPEHVSAELVGPPPLLGGRAEPLVGPLAAAAAVALWRSVSISLDLQEGMAWHGRRHASRVQLALGANRDGTLTHVTVELDGDAGASSSDSEGYAYRALAHASGPYAIPNRSVSARAYETNNPPAGDLRGEGAIQVNAALELGMDALAQKLGVDPVALRLQNLAPDAGRLRRLLERVEVPEGASVAVALERRASPVPAEAAVVNGELLLDRSEVAPWHDQLLELSGADRVGYSSDAPPSLAWEPELVRRALVGQPGADLGEGVGACVAVVSMSAEGALTGVHVVTDGLEAHAPDLMACVAAGLGTALTEQVAVQDGFGDTRLRNLGLLKARDLPAITVDVIPDETWCEGRTATLMAVPPAVAAAVARFEGSPRTAWPMRDSEAAYSVGVRRPRR